MKRPYENKTSYDPGRFRFRLDFYNQVAEDDGSGGSTVFTDKELTTMAVQEPIKPNSQTAIEAGASVLNEDCYFVIRNRSAFTPTKSMIVVSGPYAYIIKAIIPIDVPVNYIKLLCVKRA